MHDVFWSGTVETAEGARGGTLRAGVVGGALFCNTVTGYLEPSLSARIVEMGDAAIQQAGQITLFCNWWGMSGYETRCRTDLTQWASARGSQIDRIHVLVGSKIVGMGVSVASMFVQQLVSHQDRASFLEAFRGANGHLR